ARNSGFTTLPGGEPLNLTPEPGTDSNPVWSPDGRRIAFLRGGTWLYVMNADGSGQRSLAANTPHNEVVGSAPAWSPDGRKIAFVSGRDGPFRVEATEI